MTLDFDIVWRVIYYSHNWWLNLNFFHGQIILTVFTVWSCLHPSYSMVPSFFSFSYCLHLMGRPNLIWEAIKHMCNTLNYRTLSFCSQFTVFLEPVFKYNCAFSLHYRLLKTSFNCRNLDCVKCEFWWLKCFIYCPKKSPATQLIYNVQY